MLNAINRNKTSQARVSPNSCTASFFWPSRYSMTGFPKIKSARNCSGNDEEQKESDRSDDGGIGFRAEQFLNSEHEERDESYIEPLAKRQPEKIVG